MPPASCAVFQSRSSPEIPRRAGCGRQICTERQFLRCIQFVHALRQIVERDEMSADLRDLVFEGFADVEDKKIVARVEAALSVPSRTSEECHSAWWLLSVPGRCRQNCW